MGNALESRRGQSRVAAMRFLFEREHRDDEDLAESMARHFAFADVQDGVAGYARVLIEHTVRHRERIDVLIRDSLQNWELERLTLVDRSVLRLGVAEMLYCPDVPPKVTINEMVEVAKQYSTADSAAFTNGILDAVYHRLVKEGVRGA